MFDETRKYKNNGHFFFQKGDNLAQVSRNVPELPGVYYIVRLSRGRIDLVYIDKAGTINQSGKFKKQLLKGCINSKHDGMETQLFFDMKMELENIDGLDIYWFVTVDKDHGDLPGYVEGLLFQKYIELNGRLPKWNKEF